MKRVIFMLGLIFHGVIFATSEDGFLDLTGGGSACHYVALEEDGHHVERASLLERMKSRLEKMLSIGRQRNYAVLDEEAKESEHKSHGLFERLRQNWRAHLAEKERKKRLEREEREEILELLRQTRESMERLSNPITHTLHFYRLFEFMKNEKIPLQARFDISVCLEIYPNGVPADGDEVSRVFDEIYTTEGTFSFLYFETDFFQNKEIFKPKGFLGVDFETVEPKNDEDVLKSLKFLHSELQKTY